MSPRLAAISHSSVTEAAPSAIALEMRNAAHDFDPQVERALEIARPVRGAEIAVLRECDELQIEIRLRLRANVDQSLYRDEPVVADVDMRAHREQALADGQIAIAQRALRDRLVREQRLQFAPQRDALEQGARLVEPGQAQRQSRVHVKMTVDERRGDEPAAGVDDCSRLGLNVRLDRDDAPVARGDVDVRAAVRQRRAADDQIEGHGSTLLAGFPSSLTRSGRWDKMPEGAPPRKGRGGSSKRFRGPGDATLLLPRGAGVRTDAGALRHAVIASEAKQ